ncbi:hypothetical protein D5086_011219 [Populus alba]|uniref:Uncharacterized protein n=1 Tax=Populus alba TaxID=43335 RepID=A0ACC4CCD7_POPAL
MELLFGSELNPFVGTRNPGYEVKYVLCPWILEEKGENILKKHYCRRDYENFSHSACTDREREERQRMKKKRRRPEKNSEEQKQEMEGGEERRGESRWKKSKEEH